MKRIVHQRVLDIDNDARRGVYARQLFYGENRFEKRSAASAVLLRGLDPHDSELEKLIDQAVLEHTFFVHFFHVRTQALSAN